MGTKKGRLTYLVNSYICNYWGYIFCKIHSSICPKCKKFNQNIGKE